MKNQKTVSLVAMIWLSFVSFGAFGYEESTHELLTEIAIKRSKLLTDPTLLSDLGVNGVTSGLFRHIRDYFLIKLMKEHLFLLRGGVHARKIMFTMEFTGIIFSTLSGTMEWVVP